MLVYIFMESHQIQNICFDLCKVSSSFIDSLHTLSIRKFYHQLWLLYIRIKRQININNNLQMNFFRKFLMEFDVFSAPATLRVAEEPEMKTASIGLFSLLVGTCFFFIFAQAAKGLLEFKQISYSETINNVMFNQTNGKIQTFGLTLNFLRFYSICYRQIQLRPCKPEDWANLGDSYSQEFVDYQLSRLFCPQIQQQFFLNKTITSDSPSFLFMELKMCNQYQPTCNKTNATQYLELWTNTFGYAEVWIMAIDRMIQGDQKKVVLNYISMEIKIQITTKFGGAVIVEHSLFSIQTDTSIWPWSNIEQQNGIKMDKIRNFNIQVTNITTRSLAIAQFTMNQKKYSYSQKVGKIDQLFSYVGGLFSTVTGFMAFFLASYNIYKYELRVAQGSFTFDDSGRRITGDDLNFFVYLKYTIFNWICTMTCCQANWTNCKEINETRQQIVHELEAQTIMRRLCNIEKGLQSCTNTELSICYNIVCPLPLEAASKKSLILTYYDHIMNGRECLRIPDLRRMKAEIGSNESNLNQTIAKVPGEMTLFNLTTSQDTPTGFSKSRVGPKSSRTSKSSIFQEVVDLVSSFTDILQEAERLEVDEKYLEVERTIANSFVKLSAETRNSIENNIPVLILYRLSKVLWSPDELKETIQIEKFE